MAPANEGLCASAAPTRVCIWTDAECVSGPTPSGRRHKARRRNPFEDWSVREEKCVHIKEATCSRIKPSHPSSPGSAGVSLLIWQIRSDLPLAIDRYHQICREEPTYM